MVSDLSGLSVLVVDDSLASLKIMQNMAESLGLEVELAEDGVEALDKVRHADQAGTPYRIVFTDWKMPNMNGIDLCRQIKSDTSLNTPPKVVIVTAYDNDMLNHIGNVQLDGHLPKPVLFAGLRDVTMAALGHKEQKPITSKRDPGLEMVKAIRGANILLVEDNIVNQQVATELLEHARLNVTVADNGQVAAEKVKKEAFDAVLMDVQMPVMDGYAATREIRKEPQFKELPIIAMTANAMMGDREKSLQAGMTDHVSKPIVPRELFGALARWIAPGEREVPKIIDEEIPGMEEPVTGTPLELPGFDVENTLARMGGSHDVYRKILAKFVESEEGAFEKILLDMREGNVNDAMRGAHTMKGVAAMVGATTLSSDAGELEKALLAGVETVPDDLIARVRQTYNNTLEIVKTALSIKVDEDITIDEEVISKAELLGELRGIAKRIEEFDSTVEDAVEKLISRVDEPKLSASLGKLQYSLGKYDFDVTDSLLTKIVEDLSDS